MANLDNPTKRKLEVLLGMSGGGVLDFPNATFKDFVVTAVGVDPYAGNYESKAKLLRRMWQELPDATIAKLNLELLDYWKDGKLTADESIGEAEQRVHDHLRSEFSAARESGVSVDTAFLNKNFGTVDLSALPSALTATDVVQARLAEIDRAMKADAPLSVIFLVGSTLEGLLAELAVAQAPTFATSGAAPRGRDQKVKPTQSWTLSELIAVAKDIGVLSTDVAEHADQVRRFRNYIHPRQQLRENFAPRIETARIAQQVLVGALKDLESLHSSKGEE
ncbi:hypothetical protein [Gordonia soli]|uniref:Uncharacterized protein n=1 Tax=Gordonia soli NBRC 108243 TaxID=1223545 RepID=M0QP59_9ACTN|nr:hypothetical protein [Gordonia soli]GAC70430.1 hypothetical protein GS4_35_00060 [Gordonia soli NBRC 108243]